MTSGHVTGPQDERLVRQQVLVLYLATSSLQSRVVSWSMYDGASNDVTDTGENRHAPYETGLDALRDGWRLFQASPLLPAYPGTEYLTSHHKFEFFFERLAAAPSGGNVRAREPQQNSAAIPGPVGQSTAALATDSEGVNGPAGRDHLLSSEQVAEFVANGFLLFEGLVPEEINGVAGEELRDEHSALRQRYPHGLALNECFREFPGVREMLSLPTVRGLLQSLVGPQPVYDHHAVHARKPDEPSQDLHADAIIDLRAAFDIQLMYYPEAVAPDAGGTLLIPGSHLRRINETDIGRYQNFVGQVPLSCPEGTVVVLHHGLWHCGRRNRTDRIRYMFKLRLGAQVPQVRLWDTSDLEDAHVLRRVERVLSTSEPWYEAATARLEQVQRAALWRKLSGNRDFQVEYWLGRLENQASPRLVDLMPGRAADLASRQ